MKPFSSHILSNGIQVLCVPNPKSPVVYLGWGCRAGASQDSIPGIAHLCEHLMFTGTQTYPDYDQILLQKGTKNNAWTDYDATVYEIETTADHLISILEIEKDRLLHLSVDLNLQKFKREQQVVCNERKEAFDTNPMEQWEEKVPALLFGTKHPYGHPIIGFHESISSITPADVQHFINTWYQPSRISLCLAGSFNEQYVVEYLENTWGNNKFQDTKPNNIRITVPHSPKNERFEMTLSNAPPQLILQWIIPENEDTKAQILAIILNSPQFGLLYPELVFKQALAIDVDVHVETRAALSIFEICIILKAENFRARVHAYISTVLAQLSHNPLHHDILQKARNRMRLLWYLESEELQQYRDILLSWHMFHSYSLEEYILSYEQITEKDLQDFVQKLSSSTYLEGVCYAAP